MSARDLYPPIEPHLSGRLPVGDGHTLYWEECGNPGGAPVVFLHGGPGGGLAASHRRFFDPAHYRIVLFEQRGAGRSTPAAGVAHNTTADLIADIERLREHCGIEAWLVFGGSWGATLALAYAQAHPMRVRGLVLRGIFLGRRREIDWFLGGIAKIFPEVWAEFSSHLPADEREFLLASYHRRLNDPDAAVHMPAARAWSAFESTCATLLPDPEAINHAATDSFALAIARIEAHYFMNDCFLRPNQLLRGIGAMREIPGAIVQGRYDMVCPPISAYELAEAWPAARLEFVPDAGHSANEPAIRAALVAATDRFRND